MVINFDFEKRFQIVLSTEQDWIKENINIMSGSNIMGFTDYRTREGTEVGVHLDQALSTRKQWGSHPEYLTTSSEN